MGRPADRNRSAAAALRTGLVFGACALALAALPDRPWPALGGLNLHTLALLTTLILALQVAGQAALRWFGPRHGLWAWGLLSGFVSSTATIAAMGLARRRGTAPAAAAVAAAAASTAATWLQMLVMAAAVDRPAALHLLPLGLAGAVAAAIASAALQRRSIPTGATQAQRPAAGDAPGGGLRVREALAVAGLIAGVTVAIGWIQTRAGGSGVLAGSALAGLADAHAPVASLATLHGEGRLPADTLLLGVGLAIAVNSLTRLVVAWQAGGVAFARSLAWPLAGSVLAAALGGTVGRWAAGP